MVECHFCLDPCLKTGVKGEVILALAYSRVYLQMHGNNNTLTGRDNVGAKQYNELIRAVFY
jgi:hypothetical protein